MQSPTQGTAGRGGQTGTNQTGTNQTGQSDIGSDVRDDAKRLSSAAGDRIHSEIDARKGTAAEQAKSVSSAIGTAADQLDDGAPQWLKSAFQQGAQQVQRFADTLEQKDSREILRDVQDMARNNPGAFLAGCAALGFAAARILKAGAPDNRTGAAGNVPSQSRQPQVPPAQRDEPVRSVGAGASFSPSQTGEFA